MGDCNKKIGSQANWTVIYDAKAILQLRQEAKKHKKLVPIMSLDMAWRSSNHTRI